MDRRVGTTVTGNKDPVTTWDTVPKSRGCFRCWSASTAGLRQLGKTCELQLLGRFNRTCAAGLRHSVRPANCKRGPLTGFEVPKVGHPFPFLFLFPFPFPFSTFFFSELHFPLRSRRPFPSPKGGLQLLACPFLLLTFQFFDYTLRLHSQPPALLQNLLFSFSVSLVWQPAPLLCKVAAETYPDENSPGLEYPP